MKPDNIFFDIPAYDITVPEHERTAGRLRPGTQDWTITLQTPLPTIRNTVWIDGYNQVQSGVPYRYPSRSAAVAERVLTG